MSQTESELATRKTKNDKPPPGGIFFATDMTTTTHDTAWEAHCARMQQHVYGPQERIKKVRAFVAKYGVLLASSTIAVPLITYFAYWKITSIL